MVSSQVCWHNSPELCGGGGEPITSSLISCRMEGWSCMALKSVPTTQHFSPSCSSESLRRAMSFPVETRGSVARGGSRQGQGWREQLKGPGAGECWEPPASPRGTAPSRHVWARWGQGAFQSLQACRHFLCWGESWVTMPCSAPTNSSAWEGPRMHHGHGGCCSCLPPRG